MSKITKEQREKIQHFEKVKLFETELLIVYGINDRVGESIVYTINVKNEEETVINYFADMLKARDHARRITEGYTGKKLC